MPSRVLQADSSSGLIGGGTLGRAPKPSAATNSFLSFSKPQGADDRADERPQEHGPPCTTRMPLVLKDLCGRSGPNYCLGAASLAFLPDMPRPQPAAAYGIRERISHCSHAGKHPSKATCCADLARQERPRRTSGIYARLGLMPVDSSWPIGPCRAASNISEWVLIPASRTSIECTLATGWLS